MCVCVFSFPTNQYHEFAHEMSFEIRDGLFGFSFYFLLGLHGSHVVIGTGMLALLTYYTWLGGIWGQSLYLRCVGCYGAVWFTRLCICECPSSVSQGAHRYTLLFLLLPLPVCRRKTDESMLPDPLLGVLRVSGPPYL